MKYKRITALIGSLGLTLGCFFNAVAFAAEEAVTEVYVVEEETELFEEAPATEAFEESEPEVVEEPETSPVAPEPVINETASEEVKQSEPAAEQTEPATEQSEPVVEQCEPVTEQSEPAAEQTEPITEQLEASAEPESEKAVTETAVAAGSSVSHTTADKKQGEKKLEKQKAESVTEEPNEAEQGDDAFTEIYAAEGQQEAIYKEFRFTQVDKVPALARADDVFIYEKQDVNAKEVGCLGAAGLCYVLEEAGDWLYVESGLVRGFVMKEFLITGDAAKHAPDHESTYEVAKPLCEIYENGAFTYTRTTTNNVQAEKNSALFVSKGNIYEDPDPEARVVGEASSGALTYILSTATGGWYFVESGDVRGFVSYKQLLTGMSAEVIVEDVGETELSLAEELVSPEENHALYFTLTSVKSASDIAKEYASGFGWMTEERTDPSGYTREQMELIWAIVAQESCSSYEGSLAVISSAMNRAESPVWGYLGSTALQQLTAPGQYCYSLDTYWQARLGGNVPDYVKQAVDDCLNKGIRNHSHTSFRSYPTADDNEMFGGNYYFGY